VQVVLSQYRNSISLLIQTEYPEIAWAPWNFSTTPHRWFEDAGRQMKAKDPVALTALRLFLEDLAVESGYGYLDPRQLSSARKSQIRALGGLSDILQHIYDKQSTHEMTELSSPQEALRQTALHFFGKN